MSTQTTGAKAKQAPYFETTASAEIDVEISARELNEAGWHHESECQGTAILFPLVLGADWRDAIDSLHRQAHPSQAADPCLCREEPCRSLSADSLRRGLGRAS